MEQVVKAMERYGIYRDEQTFRSWGLTEDSTGFEIMKIAFEYLEHIQR